MNLESSKKDIKTNRGITLIALVITIIVLLILAGVAIATLTGDNGLLTKATDSKKENIIGTEKDKIGLGYNEYRIKKYTDANPTLTVEGTTVTPNGTDGWTIVFNNNGNTYSLSSDGRTIEGPTNSLGNNQSVNTKSFFIRDENNNVVTYIAEDGMTWEEWCSSEYNTIGATIDDKLIMKDGRKICNRMSAAAIEVWKTDQVINTNTIEYFVWNDNLLEILDPRPTRPPVRP